MRPSSQSSSNATWVKYVPPSVKCNQSIWMHDLHMIVRKKKHEKRERKRKKKKKKHAVPFHAMLCYAMLCYAIPCYTTPSPPKTCHHNHQTSTSIQLLPIHTYLHTHIHYPATNHTNPTATAASAIENLIDEAGGAEDSTLPQQSCVYVTLFARAATWNTEPAEGEPRL